MKEQTYLPVKKGSPLFPHAMKEGETYVYPEPKEGWISRLPHSITLNSILKPLSAENAHYKAEFTITPRKGSRYGTSNVARYKKEKVPYSGVVRVKLVEG